MVFVIGGMALLIFIAGLMWMLKRRTDVLSRHIEATHEKIHGIEKHVHRLDNEKASMALKLEQLIDGDEELRKMAEPQPPKPPKPRFVME